MRNILYLSVLALLAASVTGCKDNKRSKNYNQKSTVDGEAMAFIKKATEAGSTEIKAGTVAEGKSKNPRVVAFAKMMIIDHTTAGNELRSIADDKYVTYSDSLSQEHKQMVDHLASLNGAAFDKAYMQMMIEDHTKAIALFKDVTRNKSKAINDYADKTLPTLSAHLDSAKAISASIK